MQENLTHAHEVNSTTRFIFITGGVVSSLGKGIAAASLGALLQARNYKVKIRKLDPYLNIDPGTMSPYQHGEVYITDDGAETDLDLGHYERFTGVCAQKEDSITTGQIYSKLLTQERQGLYLGQTIQVIPHITNLIREFIVANLEGIDFLLCEIGGTVGDIEGLPYFETIRQLGYDLGTSRVMYVHLTLLPYISSAQELKTKPTQHSVKELRSIGIQPDVLLCRADRKIPLQEREKIGLFCNVQKERVIEALDQSSIYYIPVAYHEAGLDTIIQKFFNLQERVSSAHLEKWYSLAAQIKNITKNVNIAIVGKYNRVKDAYMSLVEALTHAGVYHNCNVSLTWIDSEELQLPTQAISLFRDIHAIIVPGGFGNRGISGKLTAIRYAREHNIPFLGICFGMQLAVIEYAQNVIGIKDATSAELGNPGTFIIDIMKKWTKGKVIIDRSGNDVYGGTMRLGSYPCIIHNQNHLYQAYNKQEYINDLSDFVKDTNEPLHIYERHRHRFEFNATFKDLFERHGMCCNGVSPDGELIECVELPQHVWYVGVQFHPEMKSRPFIPHPLFTALVRKALEQSKSRD